MSADLCLFKNKIENLQSRKKSNVKPENLLLYSHLPIVGLLVVNSVSNYVNRLLINSEWGDSGEYRALHWFCPRLWIKVCNMFKVYNKDTRALKLESFQCLSCWICTDFLHCFSALLFSTLLNFNNFGNALHRKWTNQRRISASYIIYDDALCDSIMPGSH